MPTINDAQYRIIIVAKWFPPIATSRATRALQMARVANALWNTGCYVEVIAEGDGNKNTNTQFPFPIHYVPCKGHGSSLFTSQWVRAASHLCLTRCREVHADFLLTASNPNESHLVGCAIRRRLHIPWIAFFSDPWPAMALPVPYRPKNYPMRYRLQQRLRAHRIYSLCDAVAMPSKYGIQQVERFVNISIDHKGYVTPHIGENESRQASTSEIIPHIVHLGDLTNRVSIELIEAVINTEAFSAEGFHGLLCVGSGANAFKQKVRELNAEYCIKFADFVSASESARILESARAVLIIEAEMEESPFLPSKLADYSMCGRPIMAITPKKGAIRDYLETYGGGVAVSHSATQIEQALHLLFRNGSDETGVQLAASAKLATCFSSENVAECYMKMFESVLIAFKATA